MGVDAFAIRESLMGVDEVLYREMFKVVVEWDVIIGGLGGRRRQWCEAVVVGVHG